MTAAPSDYMTLGKAAKLMPGNPSASAICRWCRDGIKARSGERIRLAHARFGKRIFVTAAAIKEFGEALTQADLQSKQAAEGEADTLKIPSHAEARRTLRAQGLMS